MQIAEFDRRLLPSLTRLINAHTATVLPGFVLTDEQVAYAIAHGGKLWNLHYPDDREVFTTRTVCILEHSEVVAAAQWLIPSSRTQVCTLLWLVAQPSKPIPLRTLLHLIDKQVKTSGHGGIEQGRFAFGIGWFGIPSTWPHLLSGLREAGYQQVESWLLMHGALQDHSGILDDESFKLYWDMNRPSLEWDLSVYLDEQKLGEARVWGVPPQLEDCPSANDWITIEWIGVRPEYRRQGIGRRLFGEQMRFHAKHGVHYVALWVEQKNTAARKLAESFQLAYGPQLCVMAKQRQDV
ncbi:MAG TPA: GNAT family N-acetyltransferase [Phototrophicaceae bacterium]|nr:GNAT family N-acetyltransferase [Phototrophicaceae bacterium]